MAGRTPTELKGELEESIGKFVDVARVSVAIEAAEQRALLRPREGGASRGLCPTPDLSNRASSRSRGGFQEFAKLDQIFVIREVNGELIYFPFNYDDFVNRRQLTGNLILLPGDTIVVP